MKTFTLVDFEEHGPSITREKITRYEAKIGARLPEDYVGYLLKVNGGYPNQNWGFQFEENGKPSNTVLSEFYRLAKELDDSTTLAEARKTFRGRIPDGLLPIADDAFGNQICVCLSSENYGQIHFWNHDREDESRDESTSFVAVSFEEFIALLSVVD